MSRALDTAAAQWGHAVAINGSGETPTPPTSRLRVVGDQNQDLSAMVTATGALPTGTMVLGWSNIHWQGVYDPVADINRWLCPPEHQPGGGGAA